jgi:hypothetical protein
MSDHPFHWNAPVPAFSEPGQAAPVDELTQARSIIQALLTWCERTGGWEAKAWADARSFLPADSEPEPDADPNVLTAAETAAVEAMRARGFAIVYWTPEECRGVSPHKIEDWVCTRGNEAIEDLS